MASNHVLYNCIMINDVPNFAFSVGYWSGYGASWTRKADLAAEHHTKLLNFMKEHNVAKIVPRFDPNAGIVCKPMNGGLTSGYFKRSANVLPKQGADSPWDGGIRYFQDLKTLHFQSFNPKSMEITYY